MSPSGYARFVAAASAPSPVTRMTAATTNADDTAATPRPAIVPSRQVAVNELRLPRRISRAKARKHSTKNPT